MNEDIPAIIQAIHFHCQVGIERLLCRLFREKADDI
jgi:hypothetical protein